MATEDLFTLAYNIMSSKEKSAFEFLIITSINE